MGPPTPEEQWRAVATQEWAALISVWRYHNEGTEFFPHQAYRRMMTLQELLFPYPGMIRVYSEEPK